MAESTLKAIPIREIPQCVRGVKEDVSLRDWLTTLDTQADGYFDPKDFALAKQNRTTQRNLSRFGSFEQFRNYLNDYINSQMCTSACLAEVPPPLVYREDAQGLQGARICPEAPRLPALPRQKPPHQPKSALEGYNPDRPSWWQESAVAEKPDSAPSQNPANNQPYHDLVAKYAIEEPDRTDPLHPGIDVHFDGKDVVVDFHGCYIDVTDVDEKCIADWSYFFVSLGNLASHQRAVKQADVDGWARVRMPARPGETVVVWGYDAQGGLSIYMHLYKIAQDETVQFLGRIPLIREASRMETAAHIAQAIVNMLGLQVDMAGLIFLMQDFLNTID